MKEVKTFGYVSTVLYTKEFLQTGLPHCHTLLWVDSKNELQDASQIDKYISVEIPDPVQDPKGYKLVMELMIHGPCGASNSDASCMQEGSCNKHFPKKYNDTTFFDSKKRHGGSCHKGIRRGRLSLDERKLVFQANSLFLSVFVAIALNLGTTQILKENSDTICVVPKFKAMAAKTDKNKEFAWKTNLRSSKLRRPLLITDAIILLMEEKNYKRDLLREDAAQLVPKLDHEQKKIYDLIISATTAKQQELLFVYGHGGGDFRQTLPVKKRATKEELIAASIAKSYLWWHFKIYTLKENIRLLRSGITNEEQQSTKTFAKWLLDVANGEIREHAKENDQDRALQQKAIVCLKNQTADVVNAKILSNVEGQIRIYLSNGEAIPTGLETSETEFLYPTEYLNTITFPGFPPYDLELKVAIYATPKCKPIRRFMQWYKNDRKISDVKGIRFTCEAMIASVRENKDWKYASCSQYSKGSTQQNGEFVVDDILDIQTAVATHTIGIGTILATSSATTTKESTSKDECPQ
nr:DNA helicase [Tanacetum cinerariifolium]